MRPVTLRGSFRPAEVPSLWSGTLVSELRLERQGGPFAFSAPSPFHGCHLVGAQQLPCLVPPPAICCFLQKVEIFLLSCVLWVSESELKPSLSTSSQFLFSFNPFAFSWSEIRFFAITHKYWWLCVSHSGGGQRKMCERILTSVKIQSRPEEKMSRMV